jgi:hypothetical protein
MWGAGNLQTGAPSGPFASARTHQIELVAYGLAPRSGHSLVRSRTAGIDPKRLFNAEQLTFKAVFPNQSFGPTVLRRRNLDLNRNRIDLFPALGAPMSPTWVHGRTHVEDLALPKS